MYTKAHKNNSACTVSEKVETFVTDDRSEGIAVRAPHDSDFVVVVKATKEILKKSNKTEPCGGTIDG